MPKNFAYSIIALSVTCCSSLIAQPASTFSDNVVRIGIMTDMSGIYADLGGPASVSTAQMAIDDFIKAEKPSFKIDLVYVDHQNKADVGSSKAREWFDREGVDMVTDGLNSSVALAIAKVAAEKKRIVLNTGAAALRLTNEDCNPYSVSWVYDTYALANVAARAIVKSGGDSWSFLTADYAFGHSLEKEASTVINEMGGQVLTAVRSPVGASDFSSYLLKLQSSKSKIIGLATAGQDTINSIKAAQSFGITKDQKLVALLAFISDIHSVGLKDTQGMYLADGWYWDMNNDSRVFAKRFFEKNRRMPSMLYAGVYSATYNYLLSVKRAGTDDADTVMKQLKTNKINDMFAKNGYIREDGRLIHDMLLAQVKSPAESKYPWDYFKVAATVPGDQAFQPLSKSSCPLVKKN